jgi:signal peptidase II
MESEPFEKQRGPAQGMLRFSSLWGGVAAALGFALVILLIDQLSKAYIAGHFLPNDRIFSGRVISLIYVINAGGVCGYAQSAGVALLVMGGLTVASILAGILFFMPGTWLYAGAFGLLLAGATGNLLDRIRFGYVIDFVTVEALHWPSFNLADLSILGGIAAIGLLTVQEMLVEHRRGTQETEPFQWNGQTIVFLLAVVLLFVAAYVMCVFHPFG